MTFEELNLGQKFMHVDFGDKVLERVAGNAAAFSPNIGIMVTIDADEQVMMEN